MRVVRYFWGHLDIELRGDDGSKRLSGVCVSIDRKFAGLFSRYSFGILNAVD